jgi:hypothetical protein
LEKLGSELSSLLIFRRDGSIQEIASTGPFLGIINNTS